jgi:hypothetical protein
MHTPPQPQDYVQAIITLVGQMPLERTVQIYEFARFLHSQPTYPPPIILDDEDWLNDSEEEMEAEDALWAESMVRHQEQFLALSATARAEIAAQTTKPLFNDNGAFAEL